MCFPFLYRPSPRVKYTDYSVLDMQIPSLNLPVPVPSPFLLLTHNSLIHLLVYLSSQGFPLSIGCQPLLPVSILSLASFTTLLARSAISPVTLRTSSYFSPGPTTCQLYNLKNLFLYTPPSIPYPFHQTPRDASEIFFADTSNHSNTIP